jgi:hypothetical protein
VRYRPSKSLVMHLEETNPQHLGMGVVLFKNAINVDEDKIIPFIASLKEKAIKDDYKIIYDENENPLYAINRSGHRYSLESIYNSSSHIMDFLNKDSDPFLIDFFAQCEKTFYNNLLKYIELFPMLLPSLWWRTQGHILAYSPGSAMGLHSDNDVNYQPGFEPDWQVATRSVVGSIIYLNSSVESKDEINKYEYLNGEIFFPYADVMYKPKSGDLLMFPSNYLGSHAINPCNEGSRYAYIGYFSQGSPHPDRGINITHGDIPPGLQGQVWMPDIVKDYVEYIKSKYDEDSKAANELLKPTTRMYNSSNTVKELMGE